MRWSNVSGGVTPEIYFLTNKHTDWSDGAYYQNSAPNTSNSSSGTVEFSFNMAEKAGWAGDVTSIRIDPANKAGSYELEYITFVDNGNQIIYDANGGTGAPVNATHLEDGIYALSTTQPIRDGFEFKGWSLEENGTEKDVVTTVTIAGESVVVYAVWSQVSYTQSSLGFASEFDVDGDFGEWSLSGNGFSLKEVEDGILKLETTVQDARMSKDFSDTGSLSSQYCILKIRYKSISNASTAVLRWQRTSDSVAAEDIVNAQENGRVEFLSLGNSLGEWKEATFDLSENENWNGEIRTLWFDVANFWGINENNPGAIEYDYIRFYKKGNYEIIYVANLDVAKEISGNSSLKINNMPPSEINVALGGDFYISKIEPISNDDSIYFAGWSESTTGTNIIESGSDIMVTRNKTLYAVWKSKATGNADFPYKSKFPNGITSVSQTIWSDIERKKIIDTDFESVDDINAVRNNDYYGKLSMSEDAYRGRFALKAQVDGNADLLPLREIYSDTKAPFASIYYDIDNFSSEMDIKAQLPTAGSNSFIDTPIEENSAIMSLATITDDIENANLIKLYVKPQYNAQEITFYVRYQYNGMDVFSKIVGGSSSDGTFRLGNDFSQGAWTCFSLDLLKTEQPVPGGLINGIFFKVNENSEWLFDSISSEFREIKENEMNLESLAKNNLVYQDGVLKFQNKTDSEEYDISKVVTHGKFDLEDKLSGINIDAKYGNDGSNVGIELVIPDNLLPDDIFSEQNSEVIVLEGNVEVEDECYYIAENDACIKVNYALLYEDDCNDNSVIAYRLKLNSRASNIRISTESGFTTTVKGNSNYYDIYDIFLPADESGYFTINEVGRVCDIELYPVTNKDKDKLSLFSEDSLVYHKTFDEDSFSSIGVDYENLPGIPAIDYHGIVGPYEMEYEVKESDYVVLRFVNPTVVYTNKNENQNFSSTYYESDTGNYEKKYNLYYGEWEYIITGSKIDKIEFDEKVLLTDIYVYTNISQNKVEYFELPIEENATNIKFCTDSNIIYYLTPKEDDLFDLNKYDTNLNVSEKMNGITISTANYIKNNYIECPFAVSNNGRYIGYYYEDGCSLYDTVNNTISKIIGFDVITNIDDFGNCYGYSYETNSSMGYISKFVLTTSEENSVQEVFQTSYIPEFTLINPQGDSMVIVSRSGKSPNYISHIDAFVKKFGVWQHCGALEADKYLDPTKYCISLSNEEKKAYISGEDANYILDMENMILSESPYTGQVLSVIKNNNLLMEEDGIIYEYNPITLERNNLVNGLEHGIPVYYNPDFNRIIFTTVDEEAPKIAIYSTSPNENMISILLSFDGTSTWKTFKDGKWIVASTQNTPSYEEFVEHGMTAAEVSDISESEFAKLYDNGDDILSVTIAMQVGSKTSKITPEIRNITVQTLTEKLDRYLYTAKAKTFNKDDYRAVNAIFAEEQSSGSDECYYFICLGNDWIYTYKDGKLLRMESTANTLFGDVEENWLDIRQYGMTAGELRNIPANELNNLLLNDKYANTTFTLAYCIRTEKNSTQNIVSTFHLSFDKKYSQAEGKTLKIVLSDNQVITVPATSISQEELEKFLSWIENKRIGGNLSFYKLVTNEGVYFVNYYMIKSVELCDN